MFLIKVLQSRILWWQYGCMFTIGHCPSMVNNWCCPL